MIKNAINTPYAKVAIAALLGFGLSTLFRKSCKSKKCLEFKAPPFETIEGGTWKVDDKCYSFKSSPASCEKSRRTVHFA
jgi:hypothetical protein